MPSRARFAAPVGALVVALAALAACGGSPERSTSRFCTALDRQLPGLTGRPDMTQAEIDALVAGYDELAETAPLAVEEDWLRIAELVRTAATVVPEDPESVQKVVDATYASERAYGRVVDWVSANCGLVMPPAGGVETTTIAPPPTNPPEG